MAKLIHRHQECPVGSLQAFKMKRVQL